MNGLIEHLMRTHGISREKATARAEKIVREKAERAAQKKRTLEQAQKTLDLDGTGVGEEATHKREVLEDLGF